MTSVVVVPLLLGACLPGSEDTPTPAEPPASSTATIPATTITAPDPPSPDPSTTAPDTTLTPTTTVVTTVTRETTTSASPPLTTTTTIPAPTTTEAPPAPTTTTLPTTTTTTTTTLPATATTTTTHDAEAETVNTPTIHEVSVSTVEFMPGLYADIHAPAQPGDYPVITLTFGRGWSIGDRSQLSALSHYLASRGVVAVNGEHRTLLRLSRVSSMAGEVACLAAAAPHLAADHLTRPDPPVWLLGYSSGAHLTALATLTDRPLPPRCPHGPAEIAGMIGLGGPYDLDDLWNGGVPDYFFDAEALTEQLPVLAPLVQRGDLAAMQFYLRVLTGASPDDAAEWGDLNPLSLADRYPERSFLLVTGDEDELIFPLHSERFAEALQTGGHHVSLEVVPHTNHAALTDPERVGEVIRAFVDGAS